MKDEASDMAKEFRSIIDEAERAYTRRDSEALERASERVPTGYTLAVLTPHKEFGPCFCIFTIEALQTLSERFRCVEADKLLETGVPGQGPDAN